MDTSVIIDHFRDKEKDITILFGLSEKYSLLISVITQFEILFGSKPDQMEQTKSLLSAFHAIPFDSECAVIASKVAKSLREKHQAVEFRDIFIAATAIKLNVPLSTMNKKHFRPIEGLELVEPS